jgi:integrase/recombinase XerD
MVSNGRASVEQRRETALRFLFNHPLTRKIAIEHISFPRRERKLPMILSREEVKALLEAPPTLRRRALLAVLYGC